MADFSWVDAGLATLGFQVDMSAKDLPSICRPADGAPVTVAHIMKRLPVLFSSGLPVWQSAKGKNRSWVAEIGRFEGSPVISEKTTIPNIPNFTVEDYAKLLVDEAMMDVARIWDETFVEGKFEYIVMNDGRAFKTGDVNIAGIPFHHMAKIMRWVFKSPGVAAREIVSVYVTYAVQTEIVVCYLPIRGDKLPVGSLTRARLLLPCLDRALLHGNGTSTFEHYSTATLGGWFPNFILNSFIGRKKFLDGAREEAAHFLELFSKQGDLGGKFAAITRRDGTTLL